MSKLKRRRRTFTADFKQQAVRLSETSDKSIPQLEQDLGLSRGQLSHWRRIYREEGGAAFEPKPKTDLEREVLRLRRENTQLKEEHAILKKVLSMFSKDV